MSALALYGSRLSPFTLKVELCLRSAGLRFASWPAQLRRRDAIPVEARLHRLRSGRAPVYVPADFDRRVDEIGLVPIVVAGDRYFVDSTAIGHYLHAGMPEREALLPRDPVIRFVHDLVEECFDELGLYAMHHARWVTSAADNRAAVALAEELSKPLGTTLARRYGARFARRQVRRLPYLFSVASSDARFDALPPRLRPPTRSGFPGTHALLDEVRRLELDALERVYSTRTYLFGEHATLADAAIYGQLASHPEMDPSAARAIAARPAVADFVARHRHAPMRLGPPSAHSLHEALEPLIAHATDAGLSLLAQNAAALSAGDPRDPLRNERAFDRRAQLYRGELMGHAYRAVAKTFQARGLRAMRDAHAAIPDATRERVGRERPWLGRAFEAAAVGR